MNILQTHITKHGHHVASSPAHSQILSCSRGENTGEGLGSKLRHGPEMVDLVCTFSPRL